MCVESWCSKPLRHFLRWAEAFCLLGSLSCSGDNLSTPVSELWNQWCHWLRVFNNHTCWSWIYSPSWSPLLVAWAVHWDSTQKWHTLRPCLISSPYFLCLPLPHVSSFFLSLPRCLSVFNFWRGCGSPGSPDPDAWFLLLRRPVANQLIILLCLLSCQPSVMSFFSLCQIVVSEVVVVYLSGCS